MGSKEFFDFNQYIFSAKRIYLNNVDSYHGRYILKELKNFYDKDEDLEPPQPSDAALQVQEENTAAGDDASEPSQTPAWEIIATCADHDLKEVEHVTAVVGRGELGQLVSCGHVVIDISCDSSQIQLAKDYLDLISCLLSCQVEDPDEKIDNRNFILISPALTWALTKPLDPENPEMPLVETDFRKRRPHPNYKEHKDIENTVMNLSRKFKGLFNGLVLATGVTYGGEEDVLAYWFQKAWENERVLPILGLGTNYVPIINVKDLARVVYNLLSDFPEKLYILGVEQTPIKQRQIIKSLGRKVGTGIFRCIPKEDAFLIPEITQRIYDWMTMNVPMEPTYLTEGMSLQWESEAPFSDNVSMLMKQYKKEKKLKPFKLIIHGPPGIGKTTVAKRICENYGLVYISPETVVDDIVEDLSWRIAQLEAGEVHPVLVEEAGEGGVEVESEGGDESDDVQELRNTRSLMQAGAPPTDEDINAYIRQMMTTHEAQNKGWIIDGYPPALEMCSQLYEKGEGVAEEEELDEEKFSEDVGLYDAVAKTLLPQIVVSLEATDEYICEKMTTLPESEVRNTKFDEENITHRLSEYRANNTQENTPLNFYDELDLHPLVVEVTDNEDYAMDKPYAEITLRMGEPCRYGKLLAAIEEAEKGQKKERDTMKKREKAALEELEKRLLEEKQDRMEYWTEMYSLIKEEEETALAVAAEPLRHYLVNHIFPTLTPALLEIATLRPEDPLDYLAEYLFKLNPTGKMLEPGYNLQAELLLNKIRLLDETLLDLHIEIPSGDSCSKSQQSL